MPRISLREQYDNKDVIQQIYDLKDSIEGFEDIQTEVDSLSKQVDSYQGQIDQALAREAQAIRAKLPPSSSLVALCVEGKERSSEHFARLLLDWEQSAAKHLVFLIGGSYGLHPSIKGEAWVKLSMSPMTFPHHLARVMLLEQLYRACKINEGSSYHK